MKKLTSKLVAFALVAVLAFALTGCFAPNANTAITFNKYPEATYVQNTDANSALSAIEVTLTENGVVVKKGNLADLEKEGVIVVEGFDLATLGANKTAKIIFGTAVVNFNYSVVAETAEIKDTTALVNALKVAGTSYAKIGESFDVTASLEIPEGSHVVLDLNGKTLTVKAETDPVTYRNFIFVNKGATLEIKGNGTIQNDMELVRGLFEVAGELIVHNGTFTDNGYGYMRGEEKRNLAGGLMNIVEGATVTIYDGSFNVGKHADHQDHYGRTLIWNYGTLKVYGGNFRQEAMSGSYDAGYAIQSLSDKASLFFYGGTVESGRGALAVSGGSFDVRGGKFIANGTAEYAFYTTGSNAVVTGVISGGEFISNYSVIIWAGNNSEVEGGLRLETTLVISGGTFKSTKSNVTAISGSAAIANVTVTGGEWHGIKATGAFQINCFEEGFTYGDPEGDGIYTVVAK